MESLHGTTPRLPALLDIGHNHNFSLHEEHLRRSGIAPSDVRWAAPPLIVRDAAGIERTVPRLLVDAWLHSNLRRYERRPYPLRLGAVGAACYPAAAPVRGPRLPLLGLRALCVGQVKLEMECNLTGGWVNVRVPK
jgi:hypothetical protein